MSAQLTDGTIIATLPDDIQWINEYDWTPVAQEVAYTLSGSAIVQEGVMLAGREITLSTGNGTWTTREQVKNLYSMAQERDKRMTLTMPDGTSMTVIYARNSAPVIARPVMRAAVQADDDYYTLEIRLIEVI